MLAVSEFMTVMPRSVVAGRHGAGTVAESLHLIHKRKAETDRERKRQRHTERDRESETQTDTGPGLGTTYSSI